MKLLIRWRNTNAHSNASRDNVDDTIKALPTLSRLRVGNENKRFNANTIWSCQSSTHEVNFYQIGKFEINLRGMEIGESLEVMSRNLVIWCLIESFKRSKIRYKIFKQAIKVTSLHNNSHLSKLIQKVLKLEI